MAERDLPDGVVNAEPPGSWDDVHDGETDERNRHAEGSSGLVDADEVTSDGPSQGTDPDLSTEE
ncbi:hypothetical protein [Microbacterium sp. SORGH_AS_0888]|uniref:hypothetical protein n=1 Tax=Microbacterium sp. SORGH_AS_0888 TaxID=3041791 RepID=UPI002785B3B9|nr:hypothetical protein [Microbacterium sp. SORGH_AS_0888]MDQ1130603.1 hypothetical protein [Microbacterium sp. SORGH_AS_0888]